ncbi:Ig-like domain-containing protein [Paenarthrobacter nitroguajacolicus]|uniref:Ig-like domain-containing protein n=1 Tax=Paenarthrobacter nitroguajacolicus TaxID=211146 RepID=UPI00405489DA
MNRQIHLKIVSLVTALLAVVVALFGLGLSALPASAAGIPDAEIAISTESVVTKQWDQVDLSCAWSVPDHSQPGDTFTLQLPAELRWFGTHTFDLKNANGQTVATAAANNSGLVVFTLSDFVATHPLNVGGTCAFSTQYSLEPTSGGPNELKFTVGDSVIRVPVETQPCTEACSPGMPTTAGKSMWWADPEQSELESVLFMPPMVSETNDVVVTDVPAAGMVIDCSRVTPRVGKAMGTAGNIIEPFDNVQHPASIDCTPQSLTVSWTGLPRGEHVELFVVTEVSDASLDVYENKGTVTIAGKENPVEAQTRRSSGSGTGEGTPAATPTPSPSTETATPVPAPSFTTETATPVPAPSFTTETATPTFTPSASPSTSSPALVVVPTAPSEPADVKNTEQLANTGVQGQAFIFLAAALLAVGSLLAFVGARKYKQRSH